jgi:hypothetical protein
LAGYCGLATREHGEDIISSSRRPEIKIWAFLGGKPMKCIQCFEPAVIDPLYQPPKGFDPNIKRYICINELCRFVFYAVKKHTDEPPAEQAALV